MTGSERSHWHTIFFGKFDGGEASAVLFVGFWKTRVF